MIRRILALLHARNLEFLRDRSTLGWNLFVPIMLVLGLAFVFSGDQRPMFKVGVVAASNLSPALHPFLDTRYVEFFAVLDRPDAIRKVARHQIDLLIDLRPEARIYWVNTTSPKGYFAERLLAASGGDPLRRDTVAGTQIRYVDWLVPGILGMNMMFSCLFGVGYVIVRYRKSGYLKRLNATPIRASEFLAAQIGSRLLLILATTVVVFVGTDFFIDFRMEGSYLDLLVLAMLGAVTMIAMGLTIVARITSEELASGLLNVLSWPMMILSGVWFSLEGSLPIVQWASQLFPLTHLLAAARAIMLDGAGLLGIVDHLLVLAVMAVAFMALGAGFFRWTQD